MTAKKPKATKDASMSREILEKLSDMKGTLETVAQNVNQVNITLAEHSLRLDSGKVRMEKMQEGVDNIDKHLFEGNGQPSVMSRITKMEEAQKTQGAFIKDQKKLAVGVMGAMFAALYAIFAEKLGLPH